MNIENARICLPNSENFIEYLKHDVLEGTSRAVVHLCQTIANVCIDLGKGHPVLLYVSKELGLRLARAAKYPIN